MEGGGVRVINSYILANYLKRQGPLYHVTLAIYGEVDEAKLHWGLQQPVRMAHVSVVITT
jgi:hypothetical protein